MIAQISTVNIGAEFIIEIMMSDGRKKRHRISTPMNLIMCINVITVIVLEKLKKRKEKMYLCYLSSFTPDPVLCPTLV